MMLGTLMELAGEETTVILMSDHGFHPDDFRLSNIPREPAGPAAEHRQFGILVANGPGLKKDARLHGASLIDITPTLLHLFGLPVGEDMDGKVLTGIYEKDPGEIATIPSWDDVSGDHGMHPSDKQISAEDSKAALDQLVALGYIDEPDTDQSKALEQTVRELDYNLAQAWIDGGIYTEAIVILERLYEQWPLEHRFGFQLATCYRSLGRHQELRELVSLVIERRMKEAEEAAKELKALALDKEENQKAEKEKVEKMSDGEKKKFWKQRQDLLARARPNFFALRYFEATADFVEKKYEEALQKLEQLASDFGARRNALTLRGEIYQRLKRWPEARAAFEEALETDREAPGPLLGLARVAIAEKNYKQAIEDARESVGLLFFQPRAHYLIGLAHYRLGQIDEAEHAFHTCVRQAPLFAAGYRMLGEIAQYHRRDAAAIVHYRQQVKKAREQMAKARKERATGERTASSIEDETRPMPTLQPRPEVLAEVSPDEVITIVSGLPRSGTSLMMQILEAAGIPVYTDGNRTADDSNTRGYYEHDQAASLLKPVEKKWLAETRGQALKVVAPLLAALPRKVKSDKPGGRPLHYRVLFMERDLDEVLASQATMLERLDKEQTKGDVSKAYNQQVRHAKTWLNGHGIPALSVDYARLVHDPESILPALASFLGVEGHLPAMRAVIDPTLHRARGEELIKS